MSLDCGSTVDVGGSDFVVNFEKRKGGEHTEPFGSAGVCVIYRSWDCSISCPKFLVCGCNDPGESSVFLGVEGSIADYDDWFGTNVEIVGEILLRLLPLAG